MGLDFMQKQNWCKVVRYRKWLLTQVKNMLVDTINVCEMGPHLLAYSNLTPPPRMLVILSAWIDSRGKPQGHT